MAKIRNIEDLDLEDITEESLLMQAIEMGDELGVDTNQGSIYRDACDGHITRVAKFFDDLSQVSEIISINTCTGDVLDERLYEHGMARTPADDTAAAYKVVFVGAEPEEGDVMACDDHDFTANKDSDGNWLLTSVETGTALNGLVPGLPVVPEIDVDDMISATLGELVTPALDMEDDDSARTRLLERLSRQTGNGNKSDIENWCKSIDGVGAAIVTPCWNGAGTVKAVIISTDGGVPSDDVVNAVQTAIDPGTTGMGEGMAPIGCKFTAEAAAACVINIKASITLDSNAVITGVQTDFTNQMKGYFKNLVLAGNESTSFTQSRILALLLTTDGVTECSNLVINPSGTCLTKVTNQTTTIHYDMSSGKTVITKEGIETAEYQFLSPNIPVLGDIALTVVGGEVADGS